MKTIGQIGIKLIAAAVTPIAGILLGSVLASETTASLLLILGGIVAGFIFLILIIKDVFKSIINKIMEIKNKKAGENAEVITE